MNCLNDLNRISAQLEDPLQLVKVLAADSPLGVQIFDSGGYSVYANEAYTKMYGAPPPSTFSVLTDEIVTAAGLIDLVRQAFAGQTVQLPVFWYDVRSHSKNISLDEREHLQRIGKNVAIEIRLVPVVDRDGTAKYEELLRKLRAMLNSA
ncbi:MAG: hypothetical protein ABIQ95_03010 [Bdellovibrionia bacterium]